MTRRMWTWLAILSVLTAADLAATIHAHVTWKPSPNGPTVMPLGQLLGWISSTVLLIAVGGHPDHRPQVRPPVTP